MQYARYVDWFFPYAEALKIATYNQVKNTTTMLDYHRNRLESLEVILSRKERLEAIFSPWLEEQKTSLNSLGEEKFQGYRNHTLYPALAEVIPSYPPAYIIGQATMGAGRVILAKDTEFATVTLEEVHCECMYSNPTG